MIEFLRMRQAIKLVENDRINKKKEKEQMDNFSRR
jgi:hypothetical protein